MDEDSMHGMKVPLHAVKWSSAYKDELERVVLMVNLITTHSYLFARWVFVNELSRNPRFPIGEYLHWGFFKEVFSFFTGRIMREKVIPSTAAARDLILDHLGRYTPVAGFDGFNECSLGQLASSESRKMLTAYMNNIRFRFKQHMYRVICIALRMKERKAALRHALRNATDERRKQVFKLHVHWPNHQVHDAICTGNFHRHHGLHPIAVQALEQLRPIFSTYGPGYKPAEGNIYYDVKKNPRAHAAAFFQMARFLQDRGEHVFQCFPLRRSFIPAHITLDTKTLCDTFLHKGFDAKADVWAQFLDLSSKAVRSQQSKFSFTVQTDGVSITLLKRMPENVEKQKKRKPKGFKEFLYVTDLSAAELTEVADNCVYLDPGRRDILHGIYEDSEPKTPKRKRYTSSQRANEIRLRRHQRLRQRVKAGYQGGIVQTMEDLLAEGV
ncbi:hypothetical protein GGI23_007153, partial [Coemansia sp. RSA 2559]